MSVPILERTIRCPKCQRNTMRKAISYPKMGKEYFCDQCHEYFGIEELVNRWNFDLGDFGDFIELPTEHFIRILELKGKKDEDDLGKLVSTNWFDTMSVYPIDEPQFKSVKERDNAYEVVTRMLLNIPEWEDERIDYGSPILQYGMC